MELPFFLKDISPSVDIRSGTGDPGGLAGLLGPAGTTHPAETVSQRLTVYHSCYRTT